jgi:hypothetical protein
MSLACVCYLWNVQYLHICDKLLFVFSHLVSSNVWKSYPSTTSKYESSAVGFNKKWVNVSPDNPDTIKFSFMKTLNYKDNVLADKNVRISEWWYKVVTGNFRMDFAGQHRYVTAWMLRCSHKQCNCAVRCGDHHWTRQCITRCCLKPFNWHPVWQLRYEVLLRVMNSKPTASVFCPT